MTSPQDRARELVSVFKASVFGEHMSIAALSVLEIKIAQALVAERARALEEGRKTAIQEAAVTRLMRHLLQGKEGPRED